MAEISGYSRITPELEAMAAACLANSQIDKNDYVRYDVKRGLRDLNGTGVLAGLTEISEIVSSKTVTAKSSPAKANCITAATASRISPATLRGTNALVLKRPRIF